MKILILTIIGLTLNFSLFSQENKEMDYNTNNQIFDKEPYVYKDGKWRIGYPNSTRDTLYILEDYYGIYKDTHSSDINITIINEKENPYIKYK